MATATDQPTLVRAQVRHLRCSARKARVILDHVRGMSVMQAQATLQFSPRAAARDVLGLLKSATANARENHEIDPAELVIDHCYADEDRTLKRFKPRARGRASSIHKRMCHVTIVLRHVPVAAARDISAAQATIAAESGRRARSRRVAGSTAEATAAEAAVVEQTAVEEAAAPVVEEAAVEETAAPKPRRKPAARKPKAAGAESTEEAPEAAPKPRKPRAAKPAAEAPESAEAKAAAPRAPRRKPAAKPTEPASLPADDADETAADEGDS
ncbi:MAG: 50S ribosomal protein L22 [Actinomycetota bacterium]|nr:50S ribosomal protein L22 [Actinomycetota bacterium]